MEERPRSQQQLLPSHLLLPLASVLLRRLCGVSLPARGLVPPLLFVSVPPLSVALLLLAAGSVPMAFAVGSLLVLAITIPFFIAAWAEKQVQYFHEDDAPATTLVKNQLFTGVSPPGAQTGSGC